MTRGEAINWIINLTADIGKVEHRDLWHYEQALEEIRDMIEALPSAQPERIRGRWEIYVISMLDGEGCRCSECGFEGVPYWDFCPNCRADMREDK